MELCLGTTFAVPDTEGTFGANSRKVIGTLCERVLQGDMKPSLFVLFFCGVCAALWATRCLLSSVAMDIPTASREQPTAMELSMKGSIQPALLCWSLFSGSDARTVATVAGTLPCLSQDVDGSELFAFLMFLRSVRSPRRVRHCRQCCGAGSQSARAGAHHRQHGIDVWFDLSRCARSRHTRRTRLCVWAEGCCKRWSQESCLRFSRRACVSLFLPPRQAFPWQDTGSGRRDVWFLACNLARNLGSIAGKLVMVPDEHVVTLTVVRHTLVCYEPIVPHTAGGVAFLSRSV